MRIYAFRLFHLLLEVEGWLNDSFEWLSAIDCLILANSHHWSDGSKFDKCKSCVSSIDGWWTNPIQISIDDCRFYQSSISSHSNSHLFTDLLFVLKKNKTFISIDMRMEYWRVILECSQRTSHKQVIRFDLLSIKRNIKVRIITFYWHWSDN